MTNVKEGGNLGNYNDELYHYGILGMKWGVRRLASGNKTDNWSDKEDFIGAHKRFMLFEWAPDKLKAIYYV